MDEGEEPPPQQMLASDGAWGDSSWDSFQRAQKHFNKFASSVKEEIWPMEKRELVFGGKEHVFTNIQYEHVTIQMFDAFAGYLVHAKSFSNPKENISPNTADRYLSSIKNHLINHDHDGKMKVSNERLLKIRRDMKNLFVDRCLEENKPLAGSHTTTSDEDMHSVATICLWTATTAMAEMLFFFS